MNQSVQEEGIFLLSECLFRVIPDVLGAVGEPHSVMPVARTAAAAAATVAVAVEVVVGRRRDGDSRRHRRSGRPSPRARRST